MRVISIPLLAILSTTACRVEAVWPTKDWKTSTPQDQSVDEVALKALDDEFARADHGYVNSFLVIRNGYVVCGKSYKHNYDGLFSSAPDKTRGPYNYYDPNWHPYYQGGTLHTLQSISKSVTSALIGIAIRRGEIPGPETKVLSYFDGYKITDDPRRRSWTLRHLLTMTAGIQWEEDALAYTDPANSCARMEASPDWVQFVLDQPMAGDPGSAFVYNSGATQLLSQILKKATGMHADAYAAEHLFKPLGISNFPSCCISETLLWGVRSQSDGSVLHRSSDGAAPHPRPRRPGGGSGGCPGATHGGSRGSRWSKDRTRSNRGRSVLACDLRARPYSRICVRHHGVRTWREGPEGPAAAPETIITEETMKKRNRFPPGWDEARVHRVLEHYESQSDTEAVAEDEAAYRSTTTTVMKIPVKLVPAVRALLAKRRAS